jgi:hypothetical protein
MSCTKGVGPTGDTRSQTACRAQSSRRARPRRRRRRDRLPACARRSRYLNSLTRVAELSLRGARGEPVDFARTIVSHGVAELPPNRVDLAERALETTLPVRGGALHGAHSRARQEAANRRKRRLEAGKDGRAHVPARRGSLGLLRARPRRRAVLVRARRRTDVARANRVRGRREDKLHTDTKIRGTTPMPSGVERSLPRASSADPREEACTCGRGIQGRASTSGRERRARTGADRWRARVMRRAVAHRA